MKPSSLLLAFASLGMASAASFLDPKTLCKQQINLAPNPSQFCYQVLHANPPTTRTSTITGPTVTASATTTITTTPTTTTVATATADTPTVTSTSTSTNTVTTYTIVSTTRNRRRDPEVEKRLLSLVSSFGQSIVDQACFEIVYGGKTPTITTNVPGPTTTKTSTNVVTPTTSVTATVTPAATTTTETTTTVQTNTISYDGKTFGSICGGLSTDDPNATTIYMRGGVTLDQCAEQCATESDSGVCRYFGIVTIVSNINIYCLLSSTPISFRSGEGSTYGCVVYSQEMNS